MFHLRSRGPPQIIRKPLPGLENRDFPQVVGVYQRDRRLLELSVVGSRDRMVRVVGMTQIFLNPIQVDELMTIYEVDATLVELSKRFGAHRRTATAHPIRHSVPIHRCGLDGCHLSEAVELYAGGLALPKVRLHLGVS